jgi:hypothetical protein
MAKRPDGSGWIGWSLLCGVPATIAGFAIGGPLGLVTLAATIGAFKHGSDLEAEASDELETERITERVRREALRKAPDDDALQAELDDELDAAWDRYDNQEIDDEEIEITVAYIEARRPG